MLILDTDHISVLERANSVERARLIHRLNQVGKEAVVATIISYEEQSRGWLAYVVRARSMADQVDAYQKLSRHLETYRGLTVLHFDQQAAKHFERLTSNRIKIGTLDLKIAAITLANDATLLSRNLKDFKRVPELDVQNWLE